MPVGGQGIEVSGTIEKGIHGPVLIADDGGQWQLDNSPAIAKLLGERVELSGIRTGFDQIASLKIWRDGHWRTLDADYKREAWILGLLLLVAAIAAMVRLLAQ